MELRVFVSSTFRDLEAERRYLVKNVFPSIRQLCRERDVVFTEIDLRWGLTEEEARHGKIIRTCLEEIDRCRPYFIGILGSRYGWVPASHDVQRDAELLRTFPWIENEVFENKSLVEIEFEYGALRDPEAAEHALFYARRELDKHQSSEQVARLRERIEHSGLPFQEFSSAESLGELIYSDLVRIIDEQWPPREIESPVQHERRKHENFAASRRHAYISNPEYLRTVNEAVREGKSLVVYAPSGSGKSALLSYWSHIYRERAPKTLLFEHYVGIGAGSDHTGLLHHLLLEIREFIRAEEEIPSDPERILAEAPVWFSHLAGHPTVIVLDALNQLDERSHHLGWLPEHLPAGVSFIVSTTDEAMASLLESRGWGRLDLRPLREEEREAITVRFLSEYHKSLSTGQLHRIANDPKCERPLFLRTLLEELRLVGNFSHLDDVIAHYASSRDTEELFQRVLERMEQDYGVHTVRGIMALLFASRHGLSEHELDELIPISRVHLASVLIALDYHLHRREGRLTFFHDYLRLAVEERYVASPEEKSALHRRIGSYLRTEDSAIRRAEEEPWQWQQAGAWDELRAALTDWNVFNVLARNEKQYELLGYWRAMEGKYEMEHEYAKALEPLRSIPSRRDEFVQILKSLGDFYSTCSRYDAAEACISEALALSANEDALSLAQLKQSLAEISYSKSNFELALENYRDVAATYEASYGPNDKRTLLALSDVGTTLERLGKYQDGRAVLLKALEGLEQIYGKFDTKLCPILNGIAMCEYQQRDIEAAISLSERAVDIFERMEGEESANLAFSLNNLGFYLRLNNKYNDAEAAYDRAIEINLKILGPRHIQTARTKFNKAILYYWEGFPEPCAMIIREVFPIILDLTGVESTETFFILNFLVKAGSSTPVLHEIAQDIIDALIGKYSKKLSESPDLDQRLNALRASLVS